MEDNAAQEFIEALRAKNCAFYDTDLELSQSLICSGADLGAPEVLFAVQAQHGFNGSGDLEMDSEWYSRIGKNMASAFIEKSAVSAAANLLRSMGATQVFIFGSAAKGLLPPDSDIDMRFPVCRHPLFVISSAAES